MKLICISYSTFFVVVTLLNLEMATCKKGDFYSYTVSNIEGEKVDLKKYRGSVSLVVNVASECGYTDGHYKELVKLHDTLGPTGKFQVLAFPCNQFGAQEPKSNKEICSFAKDRFKVTFPMFSKIDVIGDNVEPAFQELVDQTSKPPNWNFWKYLVNADGRVVEAWSPKQSVASVWDTIKAEVDKLEEDSNRLEL